MDITDWLLTPPLASITFNYLLLAQHSILPVHGKLPLRPHRLCRLAGEENYFKGTGEAPGGSFFYPDRSRLNALCPKSQAIGKGDLQKIQVRNRAGIVYLLQV